MQTFALAVTIAFAAYFLALTGIYLTLTVLAGRDVRTYLLAKRAAPCDALAGSALTPPISVLLPAYNESVGVVESVNSLLGLNYPEFEIVIVNDGSTDDTLERLVSGFGLEPLDLVPALQLPTRAVRGIYYSPAYPELLVIDKDNGGKADALNAGINAARFPLICSIDADSLLEPDALLRVVEPFVARPDRVVATGGIVRIANGSRFERGALIEPRVPHRLLPCLQIVEYLRSFLVGRTGWSRINALLIVSGAFGLFRKDVVVRAGGYAHDTVGEDAELVVRIHRMMREEGRRYQIVFVSEPVCWTEAPEDVRMLRRQRMRWQRGLFDTLWRHRGMMLRRRYGNLGMVAMPYFVLFELLGPAVEALSLPLVLAFWAAGLLDAGIALTFVILATGLGLLLSATALAFEELSFHRYPRWSHVAILSAVSLLENLGYRQLVALWRLQGLAQAVRGRTGWGAMTRTGAGSDRTPTAFSAHSGRAAWRTGILAAGQAQAEAAATAQDTGDAVA